MPSGGLPLPPFLAVCMPGVSFLRYVPRGNAHASKLAEMADPSKFPLKTPLRLGGLLGFVGGFLFAYQRSSRAYCIFSGRDMKLKSLK
jgi:hypothetical protein